MNHLKKLSVLLACAHMREPSKQTPFASFATVGPLPIVQRCALIARPP
jgi:hypothetical protein